MGEVLPKVLGHPSTLSLDTSNNDMISRGPDWDTEVDGKSCTVKELLMELYEKVRYSLISVVIQNVLRMFDTLILIS